MKILFFGRHFTYFRNFESVLRGLAERGHHIHLAADRDESTGGLQLVQTLAAAYPNLTYGEAPPRAADDDAWVANHLRLGLDYLRDLPKRLEKVTVDDVRDAAAEYLAPARLPTVIVGDAKAIRDSLETLDTVEDAPVP